MHVLHAGGAKLQLSTRDEQLDVLAKVLAAGEEEAAGKAKEAMDDAERRAIAEAEAAEMQAQAEATEVEGSTSAATDASAD